MYECGIPYQEAAKNLGISEQLIRFLIIVGFIPAKQYRHVNRIEDITHIRLSEGILARLNPLRFPEVDRPFELGIEIAIEKYYLSVTPESYEGEKYGMHIILDDAVEEGKGYIDARNYLCTILRMNSKQYSRLKELEEGKRLSLNISYSEDGVFACTFK